MQDCFRRYPEVYGAELEDDDDDEVPDVPPPVPEALEKPSPDPTKPPSTKLVPIVHGPQSVKNEGTEAVTKQILKEHAALDDDDLPKSSREKKGAYEEKL